MTDYKIIMVVLGILRLLISFGILIVALFTFLDKKDKKQPHPVCQQGETASVKTIFLFDASTFGVGAFFYIIVNID